MNKSLLTGLALRLCVVLAGGANAEIKLGVAGPITGPDATFPAQLKNGVEQAVEDINTASSMLSPNLQVVIGDGVASPRQRMTMQPIQEQLYLIQVSG